VSQVGLVWRDYGYGLVENLGNVRGQAAGEALSAHEAERMAKLPTWWVNQGQKLD
jgi:hypothetical protein